MRKILDELLALEREARALARVEASEQTPLHEEIARRTTELLRAAKSRTEEIDREYQAKTKTRLAEITKEYTEKSEALNEEFALSREETLERIVQEVIGA